MTSLSEAGRVALRDPPVKSYPAYITPPHALLALSEIIHLTYSRERLRRDSRQEHLSDVRKSKRKFSTQDRSLSPSIRNPTFRFY